MGKTHNTGLTVPADSPLRKELTTKAGELFLEEELLHMLKEAGVKYNEKDVEFVARDKAGQIVWLEKGNRNAGLHHILYGNGKSPGHAKDFKKALNLEMDEISCFLKRVITEGKIVEKTVMQLGNKVGFKKVYDYDGNYYIVMGIGENGFIVTAFPHRKGGI